MDATTMQEAGGAEEQPKGPDPLVNLLRNVWWAGLGLVVLAGEQGGKLVKTAVERGRTAEPGVREELKKVNDAAGARLKGIGESVSRRAGKIENLVDERISKTISALTVPLEEELKALGRRMEELADKMEQLRQQRSGPAEPQA
jgi:poly(hydroxyalkanoate) granule-associated protein